MSSRRAIRTVRRRLIQVVPVILIVTFVVFGLIQLIPGDIAVTLAGDNASDQRLAEIRALYGLDRPFLVQYFDWLWGAVHGDLARSLISGEEVMTSLSRTFPLTLLIVVLAMLISMVIGIPLGILAALRPNSIIDGAVMGLASVGIAMGGGTDVALETADAAILRDRVVDVPALIRLARAAMANIRQNVALALGLKAVFLATSVLGLTGLWIAILADTGATVLVTLNALRLLRVNPSDNR